ncbi:transposase family protein [Streptosporangium subroseum]|uniref:transposase family protein n=1 Tax=Streptosporangium subroseum TaxID=106412 RepID=UPI00342AEC33
MVVHDQNLDHVFSSGTAGASCPACGKRRPHVPNGPRDRRVPALPWMEQETTLDGTRPRHDLGPNDLDGLRTRPSAKG